MGTSKYSNHSTTGSATPTRYDNHSTVALGYQHTKEHAVCQQFFSKIYLRTACSLLMVNAGLFTFDMPRAFFGFTEGVLLEFSVCPARIMVADASKVWGSHSLWQFEVELWWL